MIAFTLKPEQFAKGFFDRVKVLDAATAAKLRYHSKAGAFVRQTMKNLIKNKPGTSRPGQPPFGHAAEGDGKLERFIFFAYDQADQTTAIGPALLSLTYEDGDGRPLSGPVPEILELGGEIQILEVLVGQDWKHLTRSQRQRYPNATTRTRTVSIKPRPFAVPALENEAPKFPDLIHL